MCGTTRLRPLSAASLARISHGQGMVGSHQAGNAALTDSPAQDQEPGWKQESCSPPRLLRYAAKKCRTGNRGSCGFRGAQQSHEQFPFLRG